MLAFSSPFFQEMLPTDSEKIEHFLSAHLGLADHRRWHAKVTEKLKQTKRLSEGIESKSTTNLNGNNSKNQGNTTNSTQNNKSSNTASSMPVNKIKNNNRAISKPMAKAFHSANTPKEGTKSILKKF